MFYKGKRGDIGRKEDGISKYRKKICGEFYCKENEGLEEGIVFVNWKILVGF